jgi:HEPN domain-containing protein
MNRSDFQVLAEIRIKEAKVLLDSDCYEGAYYLAGYAVECALKACIAKKTQPFDFPPKPNVVGEYYKHDLNVLIRMAGLELDLKKEMGLVVQFKLNWAYVSKWSEQYRYETNVDAKQANDLYIAIVNVQHGVLTWLKRYW